MRRRPFLIAALLCALAAPAALQAQPTPDVSQLTPEEARALLVERGMVDPGGAYAPEAFLGHVERGDAEGVRLFLAAGLDPDAPDRFGRGPLLLAAELGHVEVVRALLEAGADIGVKDRAGRTPLVVAVWRERDAVVELLMEAAAAESSCLTPARLRRLDGAWEQALMDSDAEALAALTAEAFVWVHDHASLIDTRDALLERAADSSVRAAGDVRARTQSDVAVRVLGSTAVVTGFTVVDRGPRPTRYRFMRTYAETDGRCLLLANQTMAVPAGG